MSRSTCLTGGWLAAFALLIPQALIQANELTFKSADSTESTARPPATLAFYAASRTQEDVIPTPPVEFTPSAPAEVMPTPPADDSPLRLPDTATQAVGGAWTDGSCYEEADDCCTPRWRPFIGVEAVFLAPIYDRTSTAISLTDVNGTTNYNSTGNAGLLATPRIWLGLMGQQWGFGMRFWNLNSSVGGYQQLSPTSDLFSQRFLKLQTFDLEAIRLFNTGNSSNWFSFGIRIAEFNRSSSLNLYNNLSPDIPAVVVANANSGSHFNGAGLTSGLYGKKPLCGCGFSLFYGARASLIRDNDPRNFAATNASYMDLFGSSPGNSGGASSQAANLFIGELQTGFQWDHALQCVPANAFLRVALEYQYWNVSNSGHVTSNSLASGPEALVSSSAAAGGNWVMNLVGFNVGTGFMW